ncbi:iron permease [Mycena sp. CBHHK59/15]|nr:iron permease [Mycena sp. CBHHK59/15]
MSLPVAQSESLEPEADVQTLVLPPSPTPAPKSRAFWMSFIAIMMSLFLSAMDVTAIGTALPTIATALNDTKGDYSWVGSAYALSSTAIIPLSGSLADIFGRKPVLLICIGFFVVGSTLAGAAQNMPMMIAARAVQGIGGGGIITLAEILTSDLVPLAERGVYQGIGPPIGGALASKDNKTWRWLFFLNLPFAGIAFVLVVLFLQVRQPEGSIRSNGNAIVAVGAGLAVIGLAWGGVRYSWASVQVLAPLIIGLALLVVFVIYEAKVPSRPTIPSDILKTRTGVSALLATAVHGIASISLIYYLPVFFQASFGASPIRSAVDVLPLALSISPFAFVGGAVITLSQRYRTVNWAGWAITIVGFGLFTTVREDSVVGKWVGYQLIAAIGIGLLFTSPVFPLLAPLPNNRAAAALALFSFTRSFFQTWGITICSTILQNMLQKKLPAEFVAQFPPGFEIAYAAIPVIKTLPEPLRTQVRAAFADSMAVIWQAMVGVAGLGLVVSLALKEVPMTTSVDETYALKDEQVKVGDVEKV